MAVRYSHMDTVTVGGSCYACIKLASRLISPQDVYNSRRIKPLLPDGDEPTEA